MCLPDLRSSIGRKFVMAVTGLLLSLFVVAHMLGNLQIFLGPDALNSYAEHLRNLPGLVWPARIVLLGTLLLHFWMGIWLAIENRAARPVAYLDKETVQASGASRSMVLSGFLILLFVVYHLLHFTFGATHPHLFHLVDPQGRHDVYSMVIWSFRDPWVAGAYLAALALLAAHLSHGLRSVWQSLGWSDDRMDPVFQKFAWIAASVLFAGYSAIPVMAWLGWLKPVSGAF